MRIGGTGLGDLWFKIKMIYINFYYGQNFFTEIQIHAFRTGKVSLEEALEFNDYSQVRALKTGKVSVMDALKFADHKLLYALEYGDASKIIECIKSDYTLQQQLGCIYKLNILGEGSDGSTEVVD